MYDRKIETYENGILIETSYGDVSWESVRLMRDNELKNTDWWAMKDLTMSQAKKDYRKFLRDLPQNYTSANDAMDAWFNYEKPE